MKEITVERVMRVTEIIKVPDDQADDFVARIKTEEDKRDTAKAAKEAMDVDDVIVGGVKVFIRDIPEKVKKTRKKKA